MTEYNGPDNYLDLCAWQGNRSFRTERLGQAFFNEFGFETEKSYYCEDIAVAWTMIVEGLADKFPNFYEGL